MARFESAVELLSWMKMVESAVELLSLMQQQPPFVSFCRGSVRHCLLQIVTMVQFPMALTDRTGLYYVTVLLVMALVVAVVDERH